MNSRMNFVSLVPFLLLAVVGVSGIYTNQEKFKNCRTFLDEYATTDCQRAQNIHFCTELLDGQIKSRGNQELTRLKCTEAVKDCKTVSIRRCRESNPETCRDLRTMKECLFQQGCTKHYDLLDTYYDTVCLKNDCNLSDVTSCDGGQAVNNTKKDVCQKLESAYACVLRKRSYSDRICKMPLDWQKDYKDNACEQPCYRISEPDLDGLDDKSKCERLVSYNSSLSQYNCKMTDSMKNEYSSSKCDTRCDLRACNEISIGSNWNRRRSCSRLSSNIHCFDNIKCPVPQSVRDGYAFYGCDTSCNSPSLNKCVSNLKEPLNSTRDEQCRFYEEYVDCVDEARCKEEVEDENSPRKLLECNGAVSRNTMFTIITVALLTVQMLEKYISLF